VLFRNIAVAVFALCLSTAAFAQQPSHNSNPTPHHQLGMMPMWRGASDEQIDRALNTLQRTLNLDSTQVTKIRELARSRRESFQTVRQQFRPKFEELMSLLKQPNPDPAKVGRLVIDLKAVHEQARTQQADMEKQFSAILNPAQQQTVNTLRSQAETFMALRRIGLLGAPDFPHGMFMSGSTSPGTRGTGEE
jgi:Spy/CpxP family protein refolding chaperone